jgi:hypothetical protein
VSSETFEIGGRQRMRSLKQTYARDPTFNYLMIFPYLPGLTIRITALVDVDAREQQVPQLDRAPLKKGSTYFSQQKKCSFQPQPSHFNLQNRLHNRGLAPQCDHDDSRLHGVNVFPMVRTSHPLVFPFASRDEICCRPRLRRSDKLRC